MTKLMKMEHNQKKDRQGTFAASKEDDEKKCAIGKKGDRTDEKKR